MKNRIYQGIKLTKKESEWVEWFMKGSNQWVEAYQIYPARRLPKQQFHAMRNLHKTAKSWFNKVLGMLQRKDLMLHVPFIFKGIAWIHPGVEGTKSNFVALSLNDASKEFKAEKAKVI